MEGTYKDLDANPRYYIFKDMYNIYEREFARFQNRIVRCLKASDIDKAAAEGKIAAILSVEGCEVINCDLDILEEVYKMGIRSIQPTWNNINPLSGTNAAGADTGLTDYGRVYVKRAIELGMMIDASHISDKGFYDLYELCGEAGIPLITSHSNSRALCPHPRNLTDDMFKKLIEINGVTGINIYGKFLTVSGDCDVNNVVAHIEHFLNLGGEENVCMGNDWDGCNITPRDMTSVSDVPKLYEALEKRGCSDEMLTKLFYGNLMRVVRKVLK